MQAHAIPATLVEMLGSRQRSEGLLPPGKAHLAGALRPRVPTDRFGGTNEASSALHEVLSAAIELQEAQFGDIHLFDARTGILHLAAQRGLPLAYLAAVAQVTADHLSACGRTLRGRERVIIEDVQSDEDYASMRELAAKTGYRAVHSTPLRSRSGALLGVLSLHYGRPCRPSARRLRMLDLYARQSADVVERLQAEQALRAAYEGRKQFVAVLAHELRGPLAAVRNAVDLLGRQGLTPQVHEQAIAIARRQLEQASQLVDDLFDLARLGASKLALHKRSVPVKEVLQRALDVSRSRLDAAEVELLINIEPDDLAAFVDPSRFAQVIANLLNNAAKFTPPKGRVLVDCRQNDESLIVKVEDTGTGMKPETIARVFDAFEQATEETDRNRGLGLGLPLACRIVEVHGGSITAHSEGPGKGAVFTIVVPRQREIVVPRCTAR